MPAGQLPRACLCCCLGLLSRPLPPQQAEGVRSELALGPSAACRHAQHGLMAGSISSSQGRQ